MQIGNWSWSNSNPNPIVNYTIGFEFSPSLPTSALKEISGLGSELADDLPRKIEQQAFMFQLGPAIPESNIGGVTFDELERDGSMKKQLVVTPNLIQFSLARYQRWIEYWPLAERMLAAVSKVAFGQSKVTAMILNAANRFFWDGQERDIRFLDLIRDDCKYVPPNFVMQKGLCHSFHGYISPQQTPFKHRIDNINFSVGERLNGKNALDLVINLRLMLNERRTLNYDGLFKGESRISAATIFKKLHQSNNGLFAEIVKSEICDRIPGVPKI